MVVLIIGNSTSSGTIVVVLILKGGFSLRCMVPGRCLTRTSDTSFVTSTTPHDTCMHCGRSSF